MRVKVSSKCKNTLSPREIEVLSWSARGRTRKDISNLLFISEETVKEYFEKILRKLNAANKTHAVSIAMTLGVVTLCLEDIKRDFTNVGLPQMGEGNEDSPHLGDADIDAKMLNAVQGK